MQLSSQRRVLCAELAGIIIHEESTMSSWIHRFLAVSTLVLASSVSMGADRVFERHFDAPAGGHLTVVDTAESSFMLVGYGSREISFSIVGHDSRDLTVHADIGGTSASNFTVTAEQDASGVTVAAHSAQRIAFGVSTLHAKFTIEVPRDYPVDVKTSDGTIDISGLKASVNGKTSDGDIGLRDITGNLTVRTSDGNIRLVNIDGRIDARTSDGKIEAEVHSNEGISLRTSDGSLTLRLPADVHATLEAVTSDGRVHSEIPITTTEIGRNSRIRGTINGGGEPIYLHTSDGDIRVEAIR
jgi:DUF4097 and DUF4098 domain-containing protein YvlB